MIIRVLDFETTGFPPKAGVCEIGWTDISYDGGGWHMSDTVSFLTNPGMPIGEKAQEIHGISDAMVAEARPTSLGFRALMDGADLFCAHNAEFERQFFGGGEKDWLCTYKIALVLYPDLPNHKNGTLPEHLGITLDPDRCAPLHRAGPDTYVTAKILLRMLSDLSVSEMVAITKRHKVISRMPADKGKYPGYKIKDLPDDYLEWASCGYPIKDYRRAMKAEIRRRKTSEKATAA